jgi:hypothetical protein
MRLSDRFRRWRNPAQWQDEHPQVTDGDDASESEELTAERRSHEEHSFSQEGGLRIRRPGRR